MRLTKNQYNNTILFLLEVLKKDENDSEIIKFYRKMLNELKDFGNNKVFKDKNIINFFIGGIK